MVSDVQELIRRGDNVGYQKESFVVDILLRQLGFDNKKLVTYSSPKECDELFQKGSANGGIAAAFDEVPYMKLLMGQYCSKYTMKEPTFKAAGFGFVFPLHSPLTADVSKAILNVTESEKMKQIEAKYFKYPVSCPDPSTSIGSNSLGLETFWGLFLMAGIAALVALLLYTTTFIYKNRTVLKQSVPRTSFWTRIRKLWKTFTSKDPSHHTFKDKVSTSVNQYQNPCSSFNGGPNPNPNLSSTQPAEHVIPTRL